MEIPITLLKSEEAFEVKREPYWVAPEPSVSLLDISASAMARLMPKSVRQKWARDQLAADADRAVLRNVANLDWAIRENVEDSFRRFEFSLIEQLDSVLMATRQAMELAVVHRTTKAEEMDEQVKQSACSIAALTTIIRELQSNGLNLPQEV
jgi:hypothetical protein